GSIVSRLAACRVCREGWGGGARREEGVMKRGRYAIIISSLAVFLAASAARAEVFTVPQSVRDMRGAHEEVHVLRSLADGTPLGEQRFRAVVDHDVLALTVVTRF